MCQPPKQTWLLHFYYSKTMVHFQKGIEHITYREKNNTYQKLKIDMSIFFWTSYSCGWVKNHTKKIHPLNSLLKESEALAPMDWTLETRIAFEELKQVLCVALA